MNSYQEFKKNVWRGMQFLVADTLKRCSDIKQDVVLNWVNDTYGPAWLNVGERCCRFIEEAIELVQAVGLPKEMVLKLVDRCYNKEKGEIQQELGGASVTLLSLAESLGLSREGCEGIEFENCLKADNDKFRAKHLKKQEAGLTIKEWPIEKEND